MSWILWVFAFCIIISLSLGAQVSSISSYIGSYQGGTRLTISGSGFERNGQEGSTTVYIGTEICETIEYYSNDEQIICVSPPCTSDLCLNRQSDSFEINVVVISMSYNDIIDAGSFHYRDWATPFLREVYERSGAAGDVLTASGWFREDEVDNFYPYVGELLCDPGDDEDHDLNGQDAGNDIRYTVYCEMPNNVAGFYNYSLRTHDDYYGYGWTDITTYGYYHASNYFSTLALSPYQVTPDGSELYKVESYPAITDISPSYGSVLGGGKVTITGSGFDNNDWENMEVEIGGLPCTISSVTNTEVICYTSSAGACNGTICEDPFNLSSEAVFTGGRGLNLWLYQSAYSLIGGNPNNFDLHEPDEHFLQDDNVFFYDYGDTRNYYYGREQAFFVPPFTAHYRFYLTSDDRGWLYLSTDMSPENKTLICYANWYSSEFWTRDGLISDPIYLIQGQKYYYESANLEWAGGSFLNAGVEILNASSADIPDNTLHQLYNSLVERQYVSVKNAKIREIQVITLVEVTSGKFYVGYTDDDGNFLRSESSISYAAEADTVATEVASVQSCGSISVVRKEGYLTNANVTACIKYYVSFNCPTTSARNLLYVESHSLSGTDWYVTRYQEPSEQFGGTFSWGINGMWTRYMSYDTHIFWIEDAFNDLFRDLGVQYKVEVLWTDGANFGDGLTYVVDIHGMGDPPHIEVNTTFLTGDLDYVHVESKINGSANPFFHPIPSYFFETIQTEPQVELWVSGKKASCRIGEEGHIVNFTSTLAGNCAYDFNVSATPLVTSLEPADGLIELGSVLTLYGSGFSPRRSKNIVWVGNYSDLCNVTYATPEELQCEITQSPPWGTHSLGLQVLPVGYAALSSTIPQVHANLSIYNISPVAGSLWGGNSITITGAGFHYKNQTEVYVGDAPCETTYASYDKIICTVPSVYDLSLSESDSASEMRRMLSSTEQNEHGLDTFESISKEEKNIALMDNYNPAFDDGQGLENVFSLLDLLFRDDDRELMSGLDSYSYSYDTEMETDAPTAVPVVMDYFAAIRVAWANFPDAYHYSQNMTPTVTDISPGNLSTAVSTTLTLSGTLLNNTEYISIDGQSCDVQTASETSVTCLLLRGTSSATTEIDAEVKVKSLGFAAVDASVVRGFSIESVSPQIGSFAGGIQVLLEGHGFSPNYPETHTVLFHGGTQIVTCKVTDVTFNRLRCILGEAFYNESSSSMAVVNVTVTLNQKVSYCSGECEFTFSSDSTPIVESISPADAIPGETVNVTGRLFTNSTKVFIGEKNCGDMSFVSSTLITCTVPYDRFGEYYVSVLVPEYGFSWPLSDEVMFTQALDLVGVSAKVGSISGGLEYTIFGYGFSESETETAVLFGGHPASIVSLDHHTLEVLTPSVEDYLEGTSLISNVSVVINGSRVLSDTAFTFDASLNSTPQVKSFSPNDGWKGNMISISGIGFGNYSSHSKVEIGGEECVILPKSWNSSGTGFNCTVGATPYGVHWVYVTIAGKGYAQDQTADGLWFSSLVEVTGIWPKNGSVGGGSHVTLSGRGFGEAYVEVCGAPAEVVSSAYDRVVFTAPAITTQGALSELGHLEAEVLQGTVFADGQESTSGWYAYAFDSDYDTYFWSWSSEDSTCYLGYEFDAPLGVLISRIRYYPRLQYSSYMDGGWFETSTNGTVWKTIGTISSPGEAWNYIDVETPEPVSYIRYRGPTGGRCAVADLEFQGFVVSTTPACNLTLSIDDNPANFAVEGYSFIYEVEETPTITSISPRMGTAMGGTLVTLTGTGFSPLAENNTVTINTFDCAVVFSNETVIQCETSPRWSYEPTSLSVHVEGKGYSVMPNDTSKYIYFRYLDRWSAVTTWANSEPPVDGDTVFVPDGQSVLLDVPSPKLYLLLVQGDMVFDRVDLTLDAHYIFIYGGTFEVGTEDEPFEQNAVITLHGDRFTTQEIPHVGGKMLAVADIDFVAHKHDGGEVVDEEKRGYLDVHGIPRKRTWCKLAQSAWPGDSILYLAEDVDWEAGESLVVTASELGEYLQQEEVVVKRRIDDRTIELESELEYNHESNIHFIEGYEVDMRVAVGLLSRNIIIQGDEESAKDLFGVHTGTFHGGVYRMENAEITRCGQSFFLGRYCTHIHMLGPAEESYVKGNSIHHSFQRAVTIHTSHYTRVANNVAFDVKGHTYFVEDGAEFYNVIEENLGALTRVSESLLKSDLKCSTFWTATPRNIWRSNVAAGSEKFGYWLEFHAHPNGPSYTEDICCDHDHLIEFFNNTAHCNVDFGIRVYPKFQPLNDPCDSSSGPHPAYFYNMTSFRNGKNGQFGKKLGSLHWINSKYVENGAAQVFWIILENENFWWNPHYLDSLFVGSLTGANTGRIGIWAPQDEFFYGSGLTFVNFTGSGGALAGCNNCPGSEHKNQGGHTYRYDRLKFVNVQRRTIWMPYYKDIVWDVDGTLAGVPNGTVTPYYAFNEVPGCERRGELYDYGLVCNSSVFPRRLQIYNVEPEELDFQDLVVTNPYGLQDVIFFEDKEFYGWCIPIMRNNWFKIKWASPVDFQMMTIRYSEPEYVEYHGWDEWLGTRFIYTDHREFFEVTNDGSVMPVLNGTERPSTERPIGSSAINQFNKTWDVLINTVGANYNESNGSDDPLVIDVQALQCDPYLGCGVVIEAPQQLANKTYWSDAATWGNLGIPQAGDDVVINATMWVVLDQDTGILNSLTVKGKLEVEDDDITLETYKMAVWGIFEVGTPKQPFTSEFELKLYGERTSPTLIVDNGHFLGNKVLAVMGEMTMVGVPKFQYTRLSVTAEAGDDTIYVKDFNDWQADMALAITPTEYDTTQLEMVEINSVSDGGKTIELKGELQYTHLAETVDLEDESIEFAAAVGVLNRNIKISGDVSDGDSMYGGSVYVVDASTPDGSIVRFGQVHLENVQFQDTGKHLSEHSSLTFKYVYEHAHPPSLVQGCSFSNSTNYGIRLMDTDNVIIKNNTLHSTYRVGIDIDDNSLNAVVSGNLIAGTLFSEDDPDGYILPRAGIFTESMPAEMSHNVIGGAFDSGITFYPSECGSSIIRNNEVHSAKIGVFLLWMDGCRELLSFKAWKISDVAVLSVDQQAANMTITDLIVAHAHIGVSLNYYPQGVGATIIIAHSTFIGSSVLSDCENSMDCRAASIGDNKGLACGSVLGVDNVRHAAIISPQFSRRGKTCWFEFDCEFPEGRPINMISRECSMPWTNRYGMDIGNRFGEVHINDVTFYGFKGMNNSDCGMNSVALMNNPANVDFTPPYYMSGISWQHTPDEGKFYLKLKNQWTEVQNTLNIEYNDGVDMIVVNDLDGTLLNSVAGGFLTTNVLLQGGDPYCEAKTMWGAYACDSSMTLRAAMLESLDSDRDGRRFGPVKVTRENGIAANRTYFCNGPIDEGCAIDLHVGQYQFYFEANTSNLVHLTGTNPSNMRIMFFSSDPSESVLLKIWTSKPDGVNVFYGDEYIEASEEPPTLDSSAGANYFTSQQMYIYVLMRGGEETSYTIRRTPVVQVTFHLAVESIELFDPDLLISNLALLLDIDASRIKIVDVRIGSVYADVEISDDEEAVYSNDDDVVTESYEALTELAVAIVQSASEGTLDVGYEVLELSVEAPTMDLSNNTAANSTEDDILSLLGVTFVPAPVNHTGTIPPVPEPPTGAPSAQPTQAPSELVLVLEESSAVAFSRARIVGCVVAAVIVVVFGCAVRKWKLRQKKKFVQVGASDENEDDAAEKAPTGREVIESQTTDVVEVKDNGGSREWAERVNSQPVMTTEQVESNLQTRSLTPSPDFIAKQQQARIMSFDDAGSLRGSLTELPPVIESSHMLNHALNPNTVLSSLDRRTMEELRNLVVENEQSFTMTNNNESELEENIVKEKRPVTRGGIPGEVYSRSDSFV